MKKQVKAVPAFTNEQYAFMQNLFDYYNRQLFNGELTPVLFVFERCARSAGHYARGRWKQAENGEMIPEISINPEAMQTAKYWHSTLVHEMAHHWQRTLGKTKPRPNYHNKEWAAKMEEIGLMPSSTGQPGGKKTGQAMADYPIEGGLFEKAFQALEESAAVDLPIKSTTGQAPSPEESEGEESEGGESDKEKSKSGKRVKYTCPCKNKVWGKAGLSIVCGECEGLYEPEGGSQPEPENEGETVCFGYGHDDEQLQG